MDHRSVVIVSDPQVMGGTLVAEGTRVPAATLTDTLAAGDTLDAFLRGSAERFIEAQLKAA